MKVLILASQEEKEFWYKEARGSRNYYKIVESYQDLLDLLGINSVFDKVAVNLFLYWEHEELSAMFFSILDELINNASYVMEVMEKHLWIDSYMNLRKGGLSSYYFYKWDETPPFYRRLRIRELISPRVVSGLLVSSNIQKKEKVKELIIHTPQANPRGSITQIICLNALLKVIPIDVWNELVIREFEELKFKKRSESNVLSVKIKENVTLLSLYYANR